MDVLFDNTQYVRRSLHEVTETILIAFVLVVARGVCVPARVAHHADPGDRHSHLHRRRLRHHGAAGFSINTLTLLGIVLAIGLVVDDAIVVLENIYRRIESGDGRRCSGVNGTREIFAAVVSTTVTSPSCSCRCCFMGGLSGQLFREFGMTIAGAVLLSAVVALTLTPMMSSRMLSRRRHAQAFCSRTEPFFREAGSTTTRASWTRIPEAACGCALGASRVLRRHDCIVAHPCRASWRPSRIVIASGSAATAPEGVGYEYMQRFHGRSRARRGRSVFPKPACC